MSYLVHAALALIAFTFLGSGIAKARSPLDAAVAAANFRVVRHVRRAFGVGAALFELAIGVTASIGFVTGGTEVATAALLASIAALSFFTFLIARSLARGDSFACNCFGRSSAEPISWFAAVRNGLLLALPLTAFVAIAVDPDVFGAATLAARIVTALLVAGLMLLVQGLSAMLIAGRDPFGADLRRWEEKLY